MTERQTSRVADSRDEEPGLWKELPGHSSGRWKTHVVYTGFKLTVQLTLLVPPTLLSLLGSWGCTTMPYFCSVTRKAHVTLPIAAQVIERTQDRHCQPWLIDTSRIAIPSLGYLRLPQNKLPVIPFKEGTVMCFLLYIKYIYSH